jgi:hypothetical protein
MGEIKLKIADLELDHDNPRISHAAGQQEALQKIVNDQKTKLVKLAQSIADYGFNPMDRFLALQKKVPQPVQPNRRGMRHEFIIPGRSPHGGRYFFSARMSLDVCAPIDLVYLADR